MADITVDVSLPNPISVDVISPTQALSANISIPGPQGPVGPQGPSGLQGIQGIQGPSGIPNTGELDLRYYSINNPSGFITGVDLSLYLTSANASSTYATITNLGLTGNTLQTQINNLDNTYATDTALISTGFNLDTKINSLSGNSVLVYGDQGINGIKTFRDKVYINNLYVTGTETILNTTNNNIASPYLLLNLTGGLTDGGIFFVTGVGLTGINDTGVIFGFDNITKTWHFGQGTRLTDISTLDEVMGYHDLTGYSGFANQTFSTITNLANTGSNLQTQINNLGTTYATVTNLASTGSTLNQNINNLSGYINSSASNIVFTTGNQIISGVKTFSNGIVAPNIVYNTGNQTISGNKTFYNNIEVQGTGIFNSLDLSNISEFNFSGTDINIISGNVNLSGDSTISNDLIVQGSGFFWSGIKIGLNSVTITDQAIQISGDPVIVQSTFTGYTGDVVNTYATITNLASTGSTLQTQIYNLGNTYSTVTNLALTGSTLNTRIDNLGNTYVTKLNGQFTNRPTVNGTGILLSGEAAGLPNTLVYITGDQIISGVKTFANSGIFLDGIKIGTGSVYITENTIDTKNIILNTQVITGAEIEFTTTTGAAVDNIDTNLQLTRGAYGSIYNPLYGIFPGNNPQNLQYYNPVNTMWNVDGWADLTNLKNRVYKRFYYLWGGGNLGNSVPNAELIMHDTYNNKYYKVKFSYWQGGGGGGQITYTRQLVTLNDTSINNSGLLNINYTATTGTAVFFEQPNNSMGDGDPGAYIDYIDTNLEITRGWGGLIYNNAYEGTQQGMGGTNAPYGTRWNMDGWSNLHTLKNRTYRTFYTEVTNDDQYGIGNSTITGRNLVMHDTINDKYYLFKFTNWQGGGGGGFAYNRSLVTFNENQINFGSPTNFINSVNFTGVTNFKSRPYVNGTGVLLSGEAAQVDLSSTVRTTGIQTISGSKTFANATTFNSGASFNDNISVSKTGIFNDMDISVDEMSISGLNLSITSGNLILAAPTGVPATTGASGIKGSIVWDTGFLYVCTNTNSWRRAALSTW